MAIYHTTDAEGITELSPSRETIRKIVYSLDDPDAADKDHPDVSIVHNPSGWSLLAYPSGILTLENVDDPNCKPLFMNNVSRTRVIELWIQLSNGYVDAIKALEWRS